MSLRILKLKAENYMRLKVVEITPDGDLVRITGPNEAGKSSVFMAARALFGGKDEIPLDPVRHGEQQATISADVGGDKVEFVVKLVVQPDRETKLTVATAAGAKYTNGQKVLNGIRSALTLDPLAFARMKPDEQRDMLAKLCGLSEMLAAHTQAQKADYDKRRDVNREVAAVAARLGTMPEVQSVEPVDVAQAMADVTAAETHNTRVQDQRRHADALALDVIRKTQGIVAAETQQHDADARRVRDLREASTAYEQRCQAIEAEALQTMSWCNDQIEALTQQRADLESAIEKARAAIGEPVDVETLRAIVVNAQSVNDQRRRFDEREKLATYHTALVAESAAFTARMDQRETEKDAVVSAAPFPIPGLGINDDGVLLDKVPLEQLATSKRIRVSAAIAVKLSPDLRVMFIENASLLDSKSWAELREIAPGYQVWTEEVDETGEVGFVMYDGEVVSTPDTREAAAEQTA